jgi:hypothetical protein
MRLVLKRKAEESRNKKLKADWSFQNYFPYMVGIGQGRETDIGK